jgi:hydroxymethylpyrimidine pyrophosphatase-like HAD family hydrolase
VDEWKELKDMVVEEPGKTVCISLNVIGSSGLSVKSLHEVIEERFVEKGLDELMDITHSETAVDITPKGVNKRTGLIHLFEACGIDPALVLGVGDTVGDLEWLRYIGIPACPSNATTELLKNFERIWVSDYPDSMGLHDIIQHFIIRPSQN